LILRGKRFGMQVATKALKHVLLILAHWPRPDSP
jgi:hypothetical protein